MKHFRFRHYILLFALTAGIASLLWLFAEHSVDGGGDGELSTGGNEHNTSTDMLSKSPVVMQDAPRAETEETHLASKTAIRPALPAIESRFVVDRQVRLEALRESLTTDRFELDYQSLENAMTQSVDALELRNIYRDVIAEQLTRAGLGSAPERLACGLNVCLGSLHTDGKDERYRMWWNDFTSSSRTPYGTAFDFPHTLADGSIEHRFFFSIDPAANLVKSRPTP